MSLEVNELDPVGSSVCDYLRNNSSVSASALTNIDEDLSEQQLDSLQLIQLVIWIEGVIGKPVEIDALFSDTTLSVSSIARYIRSQQAN